MLESLFYGILSANHCAEAACGHHKGRNCLAYWLCAAAYLSLALKGVW